jgi:hypothetical protein
MSNIKWVLTLQKTTVSIKGESIENLESYNFTNLEDAEDAKWHIDVIGIWDDMDDNGAGTWYKSVSLEAITED